MTGPHSCPTAADQPTNWRRFAIVAGTLLLSFSLPLYQLIRFALGSELYSHLVLIPFVSAYLVWLERQRIAHAGSRLSPVWAVFFFVAGGGLLLGYLLSPASSAAQDNLALAAYALVCFFVGACCCFLNRETLRIVAFPLFFLFFLAPFPVSVEAALESFLQHGSAPVAYLFFTVIGTPVIREDTYFQLPGFHMHVAPECSGIHSTLALFITSLVAGQVLLRSNWNRTILAAAVLPLALLRNGLRVTTIGELCVRIGPEMIDSYIHRHGGPIFFALSLVPFSLLLFLLLKVDRPKKLSAHFPS